MKIEFEKYNSEEVYLSREVPAWADAVRIRYTICPMCQANGEEPHIVLDYDYVKDGEVVPMVDLDDLDKETDKTKTG